MLDCESGFHQSEDKRNCHKLRFSHVTSVLITKLTFAMFLLKLSFVAFICLLYIRMLCRHVCFVSITWWQMNDIMMY